MLRPDKSIAFGKLSRTTSPLRSNPFPVVLSRLGPIEFAIDYEVNYVVH